MPRSHYRMFAPSIDQRPQELHLGSCKVIAVSMPWRYLLRLSDRTGQILSERVLPTTRLLRTTT